MPEIKKNPDEAGPLTSLSFGNGNRQSTLDALGADSSFTYDPLSRLNTANGPFGARGYDHDKNGNRTQDITDGVTTALAYEPNSNRLDTLGATDILLDANGNTLSQGNWTYTWNPHNRLASATENATLKASFRYNGLGQSINKTDETTQTGEHVLYGQNGERLVETDENGNVLMEYIYLNGQLLALYTPDDDQDGIPNTQEASQGTLPLNPDSDGDGLTNLSEWFQSGTDSQNPDSDGDGILDGAEVAQGTDPNLSSSFPGDGDVNESGETNLGDLVLLYQFVMGNRVPTTTELTHGDMNQDGQLTVADILLLQRQILQAWLGIESGTALAKANNRRPEITTRTKTQTIPTPVLDWFITPVQALSNNNGVLYYVHNDPLGTPQVLTDESGTVVWKATYDPFGKATTNEDPDNDGNAITFNARMPGQYEDVETGLHYNYFRHYDPATGRYLTSDPIGLLGGLNSYGYSGGNPIQFMDPFGLSFCSSLPEDVKQRTGVCDPARNGICGPAGSRVAQVVPQLYREACEPHDKCYEDCTRTKKECDEEFRRNTPGIIGSIYDYAATQTRKSQEQFDKARKGCPCQNRQ